MDSEETSRRDSESDRTGRQPRPAGLYVLVLAADPSGRSLGLPLAWLEGSPFPDYRVPGIVLLTLLGIVPLLVAFGTWTGERWAWPASVLVGAALLVWIGVEVAVIGYQPEPPLQVLYGLVGGVIVGSCLLPSVRHSLQPPP